MIKNEQSEGEYMDSLALQRLRRAEDYAKEAHIALSTLGKTLSEGGKLDVENLETMRNILDASRKELSVIAVKAMVPM